LEEARYRMRARALARRAAQYHAAATAADAIEAMLARQAGHPATFRISPRRKERQERGQRRDALSS
jgi:hypothetical protein